MANIKAHLKSQQAWAKLRWWSTRSYLQRVDPGIPQHQVFKRQDFVNNLIDSSDVASLVNDQVIEVQQEDGEDSKMDLVAPEDEEDQLMNDIFQAVSKHLQLPSTMQQNTKKFAKRLKNQKLADWTQNPLISYLVYIVENHQGFGGKQFINVLQILNMVADHAKLEFWKHVPKNYLHLLAKSPLNEHKSVTMAYYLDNPLKYSDVHESQQHKKKRVDSKATRQKYSPHFIAKTCIADDIRMNAKNFNKQLGLINGARRKNENLKHAQLMLDDIAEVDKKKHLAIDFGSHIQTQIPIIYMFGHFTFVPRSLHPNFPVVSYVGGVLKRFNKKSKVTDVLLVQKLIHDGALEIDNCSSKPTFVNKKFQRMNVPRHTVVHMEKNFTWSQNSLNTILANDGGLYPVVLAEGLRLRLQLPSVDEYYAVFNGPNEPADTTTWTLTSDCDLFDYSDCNLMIDHGAQLNKAVTRADYPGECSNVRWNTIYENNVAKPVLANFEWAKVYREVWSGTRSALTPHADYIRCKYVTIWKDDYEPRATSNFNEGTGVYAYRMNDEPDNRPHVFGMKYSHAGGTIMWKAIEHEFMSYNAAGIVIQKYNINTRKLEPQWINCIPFSICADRVAAQKFNLSVGPNGKHSNPRVVGLKADLSPDGKHAHYPGGRLPDGRMLKTDPFSVCVFQAEQQIPTLSHKTHVKRSAAMATYFDKVYPSTILLAKKMMFKLDGFHMIHAGVHAYVVSSIHSIITHSEPNMVRLFTQLYEAGTSVAPYQYRAPMSCFLPNKLPNKFTLIYNACFSMLEMQPLVSVQSQCIHQLQDPTYTRCVQDLWLAINYWICACGRIHSVCANSRHFQVDYIQPLYVKFVDKLRQIVSVLDAEVNYMQRPVGDQVESVLQSVYIPESTVTTEIVEELSDKDDQLYQPDDNELSSDDNFLREKNSNDDGDREVADIDIGDSQLSCAKIDRYKDFIANLNSILNKSNLHALIEMLGLDAYVAPILSGDCGNFEQGLQGAKAAWKSCDKRFDGTNIIKQLQSVQSMERCNDFFSQGMPCHSALEQDCWSQFMSLPIRTSVYICVHDLSYV